MKYAHNVYWAKNPVQDTIDNNLEALEFDLVYRMLDGKIYCSHSYRPLPCMYYGKLEKYLSEISEVKEKIKYVILEPKTFNPFLMKPLYELLYRYKKVMPNFIYVMSVQYKKGPHQWLRGLWLKIFFKRYRRTGYFR